MQNIHSALCMEAFRETRWVPHVTRRVAMSLQLCADTNLTNMQRQLSLEVVVTLSETAAAMLRKHTAIVAQSGEPLFPTRRGRVQMVRTALKFVSVSSAPDAGHDGGPGGRRRVGHGRRAGGR